MKIKIQFKDPDAVYDPTLEAAQSQVRQIAGLSKDEQESLIETRQEALRDALKPWIKYGEYITILFDTDAKTATVLELERTAK